MDIQLGGADESLEQMSAEGYSDYYAEDLSRRVNVQTRGIFDPEGEDSDVAEDNATSKRPPMGDSKNQGATRTRKPAQPAEPPSPKREGEKAVRLPMERMEPPAEERKKAEPEGGIGQAASTSRSILKVPKAAPSSESRQASSKKPAK